MTIKIKVISMVKVIVRSRSFEVFREQNVSVWISILKQAVGFLPKGLQSPETVHSSGGPKGAFPYPLPNRTHFFCFRICFCQKAPESDIGAPSQRSWCPQWEILDPPLYFLRIQLFFQIGQIHRPLPNCK